MDKTVRIGIVGAGVFGNYHANKAAQNTLVDFVGLYDLNKDCADATAHKHGVRPFHTYEDMLGRCDAIVVAAPAQHHGEMALQALKANKHCLIEKPIASSLEAAQEILDLSARDLIVQVGHQERFVVKAIGLPDIPETPTKIEASRMGTYAQRGTDVSVTLDLMVHDLDLVLWLMKGFPKKVAATSQLLQSSSADVTRTRLQFSQGYADLTASRAADDFKRTMEIEYPSGTVHIDFNAKTITHDTPFNLDVDFATKPMASDSLGAATDSFVNSILNGAPIAISAKDGYDALRLALMIDDVAAGI